MTAFLKLIVKDTKNKIGEMKDYKEPCDSITETKFMKQTFLLLFTEKYSNFNEILPLNSKK